MKGLHELQNTMLAVVEGIYIVREASQSSLRILRITMSCIAPGFKDRGVYKAKQLWQIATHFLESMILSKQPVACLGLCLLVDRRELLAAEALLG